MIKTIIFDFDGVIVESMDIKAEGFLYIFRQYPQIKDKIIELHMSRGGMSRWDKIKIIYEQYLGLSLSNEKMAEFAAEFEAFVFNKVLIVPYVMGALEYLKKYQGIYRFYIVSGTPHDEIFEIVKKRGISQYFKGIYGAPATKADLITKIIHENDFIPQEVVFIGDSLDDYEGAKACGVAFIGRKLKNRNNFQFLPDVKTIINDLTELEQYVQ